MYPDQQQEHMYPNQEFQQPHYPYPVQYPGFPQYPVQYPGFPQHPPYRPQHQPYGYGPVPIQRQYSVNNQAQPRAQKQEKKKHSVVRQQAPKQTKAPQPVGSPKPVEEHKTTEVPQPVKPKAPQAIVQTRKEKDESDLQNAREKINSELKPSEPAADFQIFTGKAFETERKELEVNIDQTSFVSGEIKKTIRGVMDWVVCGLSEPESTNIPVDMLPYFIEVVNKEYEKSPDVNQDSKRKVEDLDIGRICRVLSNFFNHTSMRHSKEFRTANISFLFLKSLRNELEHKFHKSIQELFNNAIGTHYNNKLILKLTPAESNHDAWSQIFGVLKRVSPPGLEPRYIELPH